MHVPIVHLADKENAPKLVTNEQPFYRMLFFLPLYWLRCTS